MDDIFEVYVNTTSTRQLALDQATTVFPNPTRGNVQVTTKFEVSGIRLYAMNGRLLSETTKNWVDLSSHSSGTYLLQIRFADGALLYKRVVRAFEE